MTIQSGLPSHFTFVDIFPFERYLDEIVSVLFCDHKSSHQLEALLRIVNRGNVAKAHQVTTDEVKADMSVRMKEIIGARNNRSKERRSIRTKSGSWSEGSRESDRS